MTTFILGFYLQKYRRQQEVRKENTRTDHVAALPITAAFQQHLYVPVAAAVEEAARQVAAVPSAALQVAAVQPAAVFSSCSTCSSGTKSSRTSSSCTANSRFSSC
jgi:hypothetical protein